MNKNLPNVYAVPINKKIGNSVMRSRAKRLMSEVVRLNINKITNILTFIYYANNQRVKRISKGNLKKYRLWT